MNEGYIKLWRPFLEWEWYDDINVKIVFLHLLLKANYEDHAWHGTVIKRGQFLTSVNSLCSETKLSQQNVRTALKKLKNSGEITTQATNSYTIVTIAKYGAYQDNPAISNKQDIENETSEKQTDNKQKTNKKQTNNNNIRSKELKELKELKEVKNKEIYSEIPELETAIRDFIEFRRNVKAPMGDKAISLMLGKLEKLSHGETAEKIEILNQSIISGWKGIFELKSKDTSKGGNIFFEMAEEEGAL